MGLLAAFAAKVAADEPKTAPYQFPEGWRVPKRPGQQKELQLWKQWKEQGETSEHMDPLLKSLRPFLQRHAVQKWSGKIPVHEEVLRAEANRLTIESLSKYDPTKAQMNTFLGHQLKSMDRFSRRRMNFSRITDDRLKHIGNLQRAQATLRERLGREPTPLELSAEMHVDVNQVNLLLQEMKDDLLASGAMEDPFIEETPKSRIALKLIRYELSPEEEAVFDFLTGQGGKPKTTSTGQIARQLGWKDSKVSQVKKAIAMKLKEYI